MTATAAATTADQPIRLAMLIDDEAFDQAMYKRIIARSGLVEETISFLAADEALEYLRENPTREVDVIFLDINMPRMTGFEFLEAATHELGPSFAKICIVMLTTSLNPSDRERANDFDIIKDYLNKPLTLDDVRKVADLLHDGGADT